ncbi:MAG: Rib/alpha-like domain-containing protein [Ligilactobacillus animalis]|uniref:Rib/alpha-like domain-containing protein n=1 Tax=Ligilactobacillus animalis TaxID=1605 RepID=UPI003801D986
MGKDSTPMAGVKVYLQWVNGNGYISKIYYTTTNADGTFAIDLSDPNGLEKAKFVLAGDAKFSIRTWVQNPDPKKYSIIQAGDKIYGFHTRTNRKNESWDFTAGLNRIVNSMVIFQEKMGLEDWLVKPEDQWETPPNADGSWPDRGLSGAVTGWVWYENGDAAGTLANQWINDSNDVKATGTKVVASYLNDEVTILIDNWATSHKGYSLDDMKAAQAEIIAKYQEEHGVGSHIAESVVGTADANGRYYIPFRGLYGASATTKGLAVGEDKWHTLVSDADVNNSNITLWNGTALRPLRHINAKYMYVMPLIDNYNIWNDAFTNNMFQDASSYLTSVGTTQNYGSVKFALLTPQPMIDILDYNTGDNHGFAGDKVESVVGGLFPSREYQVQWFKDGVAYGSAQTITVDDPASLPDGNTAGVYDVPVTVTYPDGTTDKTSVKVVVGNVIPITDPTQPTPEGYVRVTFDQGANGTFVADAKTMFDVKVGTAMTEVPVPTVTPEADYLHTGWSPELAETVTDAANYVAQYKIKDNVQYVVEGCTINKAFGDPTTADEVIGAVITGYPADQTPQPTITVDDPSKLPNGTEAGEFDIPVTVTFPDGTTSTTTVKVIVMDKAIDRTNDPNAPTPEGYVRVTFDAGTDGKFADGASYIFDVKEGTSIGEVQIPTVIANEGFV